MIGKTMTAPRRQRKLRLSRPRRPAVLAAAASPSAGSPRPAAIRAATTELIVVDRNSGLAISGFDPVAYFIDGVAMPGKGDFEASFAGAVWRFRNEGNRGAFIADPDTYMPRFGGYDPIGVARGVAVPGDPRLWTAARAAALSLLYAGRPATCSRARPRPIIARRARSSEMAIVQSVDPVAISCRSDHFDLSLQPPRAPTDRPRR